MPITGEGLDELVQMLEFALNHPENYEEIVASAVQDDMVEEGDLPAQFDGFRKVKDRYIREPFPAWTAIEIDRLVPDGGLVEIKVVARRMPPN